MSRTKEDIAKIYSTLKAEAGDTPIRCREFLRRSGIPRRELERLFGASAYSKLQQLAGDSPTRLELEPTPLSQIMKNYGQLAEEVFGNEGRLPFASEWAHRGLRPTDAGLKKIHGIRWSEFPRAFADFCDINSEFAVPFKSVLEFIKSREIEQVAPRTNTNLRLVELVCAEIHKWAPAIRRNSEEAYKSELSLYLRNSGTIATRSLDIREERSDSQCDIAIGSKIAIELKKAPTQSDYDRCFGQIARHLQTYEGVIVVIFDVPSRDRFEDFNKLVDIYFGERVRVVRNG